MHNFNMVMGQLAGFMAFAALVPYMLSILKGETKPSRASYAIWAVVEVIWAASYIAAGATTTKWIGIVFAMNAVLIFLLSLKYGMGGSSKLDIICIVLAALAVYLWLTTKDPVTVVYTSTLAASLGYVPIIKKTYLYPETENKASWVLYAIASTLNLLAISEWVLVIVLRPVLSFTFSIILLYLLFRMRPRISKHPSNVW